MHTDTHTLLNNYFFAAPCFLTLAIALATVSSSPMNVISPVGFKSGSESSYENGMPVGKSIPLL